MNKRVTNNIHSESHELNDEYKNDADYSLKNNHVYK